jgi:dTDP-4-amino-4,6-dideoxygalactose transaminase
MIPIIDLKAQYSSIREEIQQAIDGVLNSSQFILGEEVQKFEEEFSGYVGGKFGVAVNSGTSALHLALLAADIGPGDEVLTVPATFVATAAAIAYAGARPVFVDVDPQTLTIDPSKLEGAITENTKAILPVHLYGHPAEMEPILEIAKKRNLIVIEDTAQAHGAEYQGKRVGSLGDFGCFSFYPSKNLGAYGEAGMVVTNDAEAANRLRMLRDWGQSKKYHHDTLGFNYRMDGIQGAILRVKLRHLDDWTEARRQNAKRYNEVLKDSGLALPIETQGNRHVYYVYVVRVPNREAMQKHLLGNDIHSAIHYPHPVHLEKAFEHLAYSEGDFPVSEKAAKEVLSLPMYPELQAEQIEEVAAAIRSFS